MLRLAVHRAGRRAALDCRRALATQPQSGGPGLPGQGTMSEEQANRTGDRLYQGEAAAAADRRRRRALPLAAGALLICPVASQSWACRACLSGVVCMPGCPCSIILAAVGLCRGQG